MTADKPRLPSASVYSDQPASPSSVVIFRNENVRQPASQCRLSTVAIFIGRLPSVPWAELAPSHSGQQVPVCYTWDMRSLLLPMSRALAQLSDPALLGVVWRSVLWSALFFIVILAGTVGAVHHYASGHGVLAWVLDALGSIAAAVLAMWLFLPVAAAIGTLYFERIARAVERVFYPSLPPAEAAPMLDQVRDSLAVGLRVLGLNVLALLLTLFLPGIGFPIGWAVASWAIGRGLFVAVAMRRLSRPDAEALYRA